MSFGFEKKTALVTGAAGGIGRAAALAFAQAGARLVLADQDAEKGRELLALLQKQGAEAVFVEADVSQENQVQAMVETALKTYGRLDCAFNNAGISGKGTGDSRG